MECKHKKEHMLCNGAEYCMNTKSVQIEIAQYKRKSRACFDMAEAVRDGKFKSFYTSDELFEKSNAYSDKAKFLKKNYDIIQVFCLGDGL